VESAEARPAVVPEVAEAAAQAEVALVEEAGLVEEDRAGEAAEGEAVLIPPG
jgi:hypothetical protein